MPLLSGLLPSVFPFNLLTFALTRLDVAQGDTVAEVRDKLPGAVAAREKQWLLDQGKWEIWASTENCHLISHCLRTAFTECDMTDREGTLHLL
jgi:hypothetical protein